MPADLIRLVRHGEVYNPDGILYGRIPGYHLSELGHAMADAAAESLNGHPITALYASPLQRAQESAAPWAERFELPIVTEERIIEPHNWFEGRKFEFPSALKHPRAWPKLINPLKPSWGEPYRAVESRMLAAIGDAWAAADGGEVVMVSHQMPIVMVARSVKNLRLFHDPRNRRCTLSSITTLALREPSPPPRPPHRFATSRNRAAWAQGPGAPRFVEVDYQEPARELLESAIDSGAV